MTIPFRVKLLTSTAKLPHRNCESDLWDLYADDFCSKNLKDTHSDGDNEDLYSSFAYDNLEFEENYEDKDYFFNRILINTVKNKKGSLDLHPQGRILVKTGITIELPKQIKNTGTYGKREPWVYGDLEQYTNYPDESLIAYAVADIRPRSGLALKHGITVLNTPGTIDNSYRKEIGVILYNAGHKPYTITKGDKICQMLVRPLYPSKMEIVENIEDTGRGGYGSTGK